MLQKISYAIEVSDVGQYLSESLFYLTCKLVFNFQRANLADLLVRENIEKFV